MHTNDNNLRCSAVWDIETKDWDQFVCGALWFEGSGTAIYTDESELARAVLGLPPGTQVWAHAGGRFDVLWLIDWMRRNKRVPDVRITMSGSSIASCAITGGPTLRDSYRLVPMSLKKASAMFGGGVGKETLGLPCVCGKNCGGYCSIGPDLTPSQRKRLYEYLAADIEALRDTLNGLTTYAAAHDVHLAGTIASSTWETAKAWCGLEDAEWSAREYKLVRAGYYGGRVEVAQTECDRVWRYDRTQAYPSAMCGALPAGYHRALSGKQAMSAWTNGKPGFYNARVRVPNMLAPPLPYRWGARLTYPWGDIDGTWPRDELRHAEEVGCKILRINHAIAWAEEVPVLRGYMEHCFALREKADTESLKLWLKLLANSLSGAFAQDPERDIILLGDYADDERYEQVGRYDWIWRRSVFQIPGRGHVHWAGTLTGDARVELAREIEHAGESWCYSDTDSVIASSELTRNVGHGLGVWKFEGEATAFEAIAPKVYSFVEEGGKRKARAKGISSAPDHWEAIRNREEVAIEGGVESFLVASRGDKLFKKRVHQRRLKPETAWCGGRLRDGTRTRAPSTKELEELPR